MQPLPTLFFFLLLAYWGKCSKETRLIEEYEWNKKIIACTSSTERVLYFPSIPRCRLPTTTEMARVSILERPHGDTRLGAIKCHKKRTQISCYTNFVFGRSYSTSQEYQPLLPQECKTYASDPLSFGFEKVGKNRYRKSTKAEANCAWMRTVESTGDEVHIERNISLIVNIDKRIVFVPDGDTSGTSLSVGYEVGHLKEIYVWEPDSAPKNDVWVPVFDTGCYFYDGDKLSCPNTHLLFTLKRRISLTKSGVRAESRTGHTLLVSKGDGILKGGQVKILPSYLHRPNLHIDELNFLEQGKPLSQDGERTLAFVTCKMRESVLKIARALKNIAPLISARLAFDQSDLVGFWNGDAFSVKHCARYHKFKVRPNPEKCSRWPITYDTPPKQGWIDLQTDVVYPECSRKRNVSLKTLVLSDGSHVADLLKFEKVISISEATKVYQQFGREIDFEDLEETFHNQLELLIGMGLGQAEFSEFGGETGSSIGDKKTYEHSLIDIAFPIPSWVWGVVIAIGLVVFLSIFYKLRRLLTCQVLSRPYRKTKKRQDLEEEIELTPAQRMQERLRSLHLACYTSIRKYEVQ